MKGFLKLVGLLLALAVAYLVLWPVKVDPAAWTPPSAPPLQPNHKLAGGERLLAGQGTGPEALAFDAAGNLYTGYVDGRIVRMKPDRTVATFATTGGRPLGMKFDAAGRLIVADARAGLLAVDPAGKVETLVADYQGARFGFTDDVAIADDGTIYFSDASSRFGYGQDRMDIIEHRPNGRVYAYDPAARKLTLLIDKLYFANGTALAADGSYLLVNETSAYRVSRHWLSGPKKGTTEPFVENLPGFPDNLTRSPRGGFWVALYSPRVAAFDKLLPHPFLRKIVARLPSFAQPQPIRHALVAHLDENGKITEVLDDDSADAYAPVTSCLERDGKLWLGSLVRDAIAVVPVP